MLTLLAEQPECLWDDVVAGRGEGAAGGSGGVGCVVGRSRVAVAVGGALASGVPGDRTVGVDRGAADDRAGDVCAVDGAQAALPVGVPDAGGGGVGLDSSAAVLPDLAVGAGAGRVDGPQAHPADRCGDGVGADARVDRQGDAGEAVSAAGGADRLDGDRGGCEVSDRCGVGLERGAGAGPGGSQARQAVKEKKARVRDRSRAMGRKLRAITRTIRRRSGRGQAGSAEADRRDRRAVGALDQGGAPARAARPAQGARAWRAARS